MGFFSVFGSRICFRVTRSEAIPEGILWDDQRRLLRPNCSAPLPVELDRGSSLPLPSQSTAHSQWNQRLASTGIRNELMKFAGPPSQNRGESDSSRSRVDERIARF